VIGEMQQRGIPDVPLVRRFKRTVVTQFFPEPISERVCRVIDGKRADHHTRRRQRQAHKPQPNPLGLCRRPLNGRRAAPHQRIHRRQPFAMNLDRPDREMNGLHRTSRPLPTTSHRSQLRGQIGQTLSDHTFRHNGAGQPPPATLHRRDIDEMRMR
jgi:hypothetical protein